MASDEAETAAMASDEAETAAPTRPWAPWLAGLVPLCLYMWSTGGHSYWLDSGEFTAASVWLDIAHPPGQPIACLWGKLFALLPVGPLPFRVALGQAVATSLSLALLCAAFARSMALVGLSNRLARELLALAGSWLLALSYAFWFQSVRQEVYAVQALFLCLSLERLTYAASLEGRDPRPFYAATLALGLGLANHHFMSVLGIPVLLFELVRLTRVHGLKPWLVGVALGILGLGTYVYLPVRASTLPPMNLGDPSSLRNLWWVVSAQIYARKIGSEAVQPMGERFADLAVLMVENLSIPVVCAALLGAYVLVRTPRVHAVAWIWGVTALLSLGLRAWLNPVRDNPDVLGYMLPGFAAVMALALCGIATPLVLLVERLRNRHVATLAAICLLAVPVLRMPAAWQRASLAAFHATDDFDQARRRSLPARTLLVLLTPEAIFRHWDGEAVEQLRPDVTLVPVPFLAYGDTGTLLARAHPELAPLVEGYLRDDSLSVAALLTLSDTRPVLIEADSSLALPLFPHLLPHGLLYRVTREPRTSRDIVLADLARRSVHERLYRDLGEQYGEPETRRKLLWIHYMDALYYAYHGTVSLAAVATAQGLELEPKTRELLGLKHALSGRAAGPMDIRSFLVGAAP